ncbi:MAG: hypothetical protein ABIJ42_08825 [Acidobacteriota bacterium]
MGLILKRPASILILLFFLWCSLSAQTGTMAPASTCFVFIDTQYIWTLELVTTPDNRPVPILNILTLTRGEWDFRPVQISMVNMEGRIADVNRFSMNTGVEGEPYLTNYLKVLGNNFIGVDLIGEFGDFRQLSEVSIELGKDIFRLTPVHSVAFESLVSRINQINVDSPDIREDFQVLGINLLGERELLNQVY